MNTLQGKAVVITGAGQGLGEAFARLAAAEGARVVVNDIDAQQAGRVVEAIRQAGGTASLKVADISNWAEAEALVGHCVATFGALDGFVNNAALFHLASPEEETEARVRRIVEVNVLGSAFCGYVALRQMLRQGRGSLVNITSGAHAGIRAMSAYGATKGAVASMTYAWALDTAGTGVRVNAVSPMAHTRMHAVGEAYREGHGGAPNPRPHIAPESNAPVVVYLLSDPAAGVTGQVVRIQGNALNLMTHPAALQPGASCDAWTVDEVREVFERQLRAQQLPCGVQGYKVELQDYTLPYRPAG